MSAISLKSITGITSITTPTGVDDQLTLHNNNTTERVKIDTAGNVHINNHLAIAGVATASTFVGALTGTASGNPTLTNGSNNRVVTATSSTGLNAESNLTYDGNSLFASGNITAASDGNRLTQGGVALVVRHSTNSAMRANHFIHDDFPSGSATYYIQATESGVTNDRNLALQGYGGKVKIGSGGVEPVETLDVSGNVKATSINLANSIFHTGDTDTLMSFSTDTIRFETAGSERLRIQGNGLVGIGTNNAGAPLHIQSDVAGLSIRRGGQYLQFDANFGNGGDQSISSSAGFRVQTGGVGNTYERVRITTGGQLLVGTTSANRNNKIHARLASGSIANNSTASVILAENSGNTWITIGSGASNYGGILFADSGSSDIGQVRYDHNNNALEFLTNGGNSSNIRLKIDSSGHLLPGANTSYDLGANVNNRWRNIYGQTLSLTSYATVASIVATDPGSSYYAYNNRIGNGLAIVGTTRMFGSVGVGTGSPVTNLDVRGSSDASITIGLNNGTKYGNFSCDNSATYLYAYNGNDIIFSTHSGNSFNRKVTLKNDGNFGINDASPSYKLNVIGDNTASNGIGMLKGIIGVQNDTTAYGSSPTAGISFQTKYRTGPDVPLDVAAIWGGKENTTNGDKDGYMGFATREEGGSGSQERMRITSSGQLAIGGTTNVGTLLHIENGSGDAYIRCRASINKALLFNNSDGTAHGFLGSGGTNGGAGADLAIQSNSGNVMFYANNGLRAKVTSDGFVSHNNTSGDGDDDIAVALENDYSSWAVIYKNDWIGTAGGWGTYWAGNSGAAYRRVSSDNNPNEHVMVGSGAKRFTFDLDNGNMYYDGSVAGSPYDYAEYFEWEDGNPSNEDRRGYSVFVNSNGKIEKATDSTNTSDIIGVISGTAAILGDAAVYDWQGKWKVDEWGTVMRETVKQVTWKDEDGKNHSYDEDKVPSGLTIPSDASYRQHTRRILNSDYDESKEYVPRDMRQEWDPVGLLGKVRVRDDSPKNPNWKFIKVVNGKKMWLIR